MNKNNLHEIILTLNREGVPGLATTTFVFLWGFGTNQIDLSQRELALASGFKKRTIRDHLYKLRDAGLIEYHKNNTRDNTIYLKRFKHN